MYASISFSANAAKEIAHGVSKLERQGAEAYILDLRNNPGGLLQAGVGNRSNVAR